MAILPFTPTPDPIHAVLGATYLLALASPMVLSAYLRAFVPARWTAPDPLPLYAGVLATLGALGVAVLGASILLAPLPGSAGTALATLAVAPALGWLAFAIERRHTLRRRRAGLRIEAAAPPRMHVRAASPWAAPAPESPARTRPAPALSATPLLMATIAVLEEVVFRAVLLSFLPVLMPGAHAGWIAAACCLWFCLAHVQFGVAQVWLKLPLSLFATVLYLAGGVPAAALVHVVFNLLAVRQRRHAAT